MASIKNKPQEPLPPSVANGTAYEILTLAEAASYLRVREADVLQLVCEQGLPARQVGAEWRFFKSAVQRWLSQPFSASKPNGIWGAAGSWKNDPFLDDMLKEIYRRRGRPMTEAG